MAKQYEAYQSIKDFLEQELDYTVTSDQPVLKVSIDMTLTCNRCGAPKTCKPSQLITGYKKHGTRGCASCNNKAKAEKGQAGIAEVLAAIELELGLKLVGEPPAKHKDTCTFLSTACGHELTSTIDSVRTSQTTKCKACSKLEQAANSRAAVRERWSNVAGGDAPTYAGYVERVRAVTTASWRQREALINPNNLPRTPAADKTGYRIVQAIPAQVGFNLRIPPEVIGDAANLFMMNWEQNAYSPQQVDCDPFVVAEQFRDRVKQLCELHNQIIEMSDTGVLSVTDVYVNTDAYDNFHWQVAMAAGKTTRWTHDEFVAKVAQRRPDLKVVGQFVNTTTKVTIECSKGHQWEGRPMGIVRNGHGCPVCATQRFE